MLGHGFITERQLHRWNYPISYLLESLSSTMKSSIFIHTGGDNDCGSGFIGISSLPKKPVSGESLGIGVIAC